MSRYACGHSGLELQRLELQGRLYERITRAVLAAAGLRRGMRVLDIGCGAGDVSLLAAEMVGRGGSVLGVDRAEAPLRLARERAARRGLRHVTFARSAVAALRLSPVDALVGRFVLMHQRRPARLLRAAARRVRPGGIVAILESHLVGPLAGNARAGAQFLGAIRRTLTRAGVHLDMGLRLRAVFLQAGLPAPELWLQARLEGGRDARLPGYFADSLRSLRAAPGEAERLERRLRLELEEPDAVVSSPLVVGAWCRVQAASASSTPRM